MENFRITLEAGRINAGLSRHDVAKELGVSEATVGNWEVGKTEPTITKAIKLAELFRVPIDNLIFVPIESN